MINLNDYNHGQRVSDRVRRLYDVAVDDLIQDLQAISRQSEGLYLERVEFIIATLRKRLIEVGQSRDIRQLREGIKATLVNSCVHFSSSQVYEIRPLNETVQRLSKGLLHVRSDAFMDPVEPFIEVEAEKKIEKRIVSPFNEFPEERLASLFQFLNANSSAKKVLRAYIMDYVDRLEKRGEFFEKFDFDKRILRGVTTSLNEAISLNLVQVVLQNCCHELGQALSDLGFCIALDKEGLVVEYPGLKLDDDVVGDIFYSAQSFPEVKIALIDNYFRVIKKAGYQQKQVFKITEQKKSNWDSLKKNTGRLNYRWVNKMIETGNFELSDFMTEEFNLYESEEGLVCEISL